MSGEPVEQARDDLVSEIGQRAGTRYHLNWDFGTLGNPKSKLARGSKT